jgi:putative tricarboxylic transport membrane protein
MTQQEMTKAASPPLQPPMPSVAWQTGVGWVVVLCALAWAVGVLAMPASTPWRGGGARLVPALCAVVLLVCGVWLIWEARHGGWRNAAALSGHRALQWRPWAWVSAGLLLGGVVLPVIGFVLAATLTYVLALQGLRAAAGSTARTSVQRWLVDGAWGLVLASVVWLGFSQGLGVALPLGWWAWK